MRILCFLFRLLRLAVSSHAALVAENLALRQQIIVLQRGIKRPRIKRRDRIFWAWLSRLWADWRSALVIVQPDTDLPPIFVPPTMIVPQAQPWPEGKA